MRSRLLLAVACALVVGAVPPLDPASADDPPPSEPSDPGRLAYSTGIFGNGITVHGLGTMGLDGSDRRTLTDPQEPAPGGGAGYDHSPQWSPDGAWLAYSQSRPDGLDGRHSVQVIPRDGGVPQEVDADGSDPAWSPDGRHLAWISRADDHSFRLGIAEVVTTPSRIEMADRRWLELPDPSHGVGGPVFSPDGLHVTFANGAEPNRSLYSMSVTGDDLREVTHDLTVGSGPRSFQYSPDGGELLFQAALPETPNEMATYVVDAGGGNPRRISPEGVFPADAAWSPTGDAVALGLGPWEGIGIFDLEGHRLQSIATTRFSATYGLTYSPDGSHIYSVATPFVGEWTPDLYAIPVDDGQPERLTDDQSVFPWTVQAIDPGLVVRQFGDGAVDSAASAATADLDSADTVVVVPADDFAASLAAAPLAAQLEAPTLMSATGSLDEAVAQAADRLGASRAVLVGGFSPDVEQDLRASSLEVTRVGQQASPYRTAADLASGLTSRKAFVVPLRGRHDDWALPLATAGLAAQRGGALLYATPTKLPRTTRRAIRSQGISTVTVVGGDRHVRPHLLRQLSRLGVVTKRVRSSDRYAVSAALADRAVAAGASTDDPVVSSGTRWTPSVAAPGLAALLGQVNVLVDHRTLSRSQPTARWLGRHRRAIEGVQLLGGPRTVRPPVEVALEGLVD